MVENFFYVVDCWRNINLWCKMVCVKSITYSEVKCEVKLVIVCCKNKKRR